MLDCLGLLWCSTSYSNIIMQDLIDALVETKKPKSIEVANNLKSQVITINLMI